MKVTAKWEVTSVINRELKKKKRKIDRAQYLKLLRDSQKFSILQRVAAELYRAGVTPQRFLRELHKDDWSMSSRVMEELERIDKGRNGYDPDKVPPLLPVYLKPVAQEAAIAFVGRPKRSAAEKEALRWIKQLLESGWTEGDVSRAVDDVLSASEKVIIVQTDEDLPPEKPKVQTKFKYYVHDGLDWQVFISPKKAKEAMDVEREKVMGNIRRAEPMPDITARICAECKQPLNGHVMTIRGEKQGKKPRKVIEHLHPNCYWLKRVEAVRIPTGMELLNPADGKLYIWTSPEKGGWRLKHEIKKEATAVPNSSAPGVPGESNPNTPAALPTTTPT